jgi:hypothetical protein
MKLEEEILTNVGEVSFRRCITLLISLPNIKEK